MGKVLNNVKVPQGDSSVELCLSNNGVVHRKFLFRTVPCIPTVGKTLSLRGFSFIIYRGSLNLSHDDIIVDLFN